MNRRPVLFVLVLVAAPLAGHSSDRPDQETAVAASRTRSVGFRRDVWPIFRRHCRGCHSGSNAKGGLSTDSVAAMLKGGDSGPLFEPGEPDGSLLLEMITGDEPEMPKQQPPLSVAKIDILRKWILAGARDDSTGRGSQPAVVIPESYRYAPSVASVSLSPDGKLVAAAYRSEVVLVDVEGDAAPRRLPTECGLLTHVEFSPDGTLLAAVGGSPSQFGEVRFFNVADGRTVASRRVGHDTLFRGNFAPDSKSIALGGTDGAAHVVPLESTDGVRSFPLHSDWVLDVAYTPDGRMLVTGGRDKATKVCSVETGRLLRSINMSTEMIGSVACNAEFAFSSGRARTLNGFELKIALSGIELTGVDNRAGPDTKRNLYLKSLEPQPGHQSLGTEHCATGRARRRGSW